MRKMLKSQEVGDTLPTPSSYIKTDPSLNMSVPLYPPMSLPDSCEEFEELIAELDALESLDELILADCEA